ncbi:conserved hypothetical protein [Agrobacterium genomosp. 13 str. CFBP 6927]|uniref:Uncharacterized protein n=1 Tax=Agrobacterium genomosp. 13 str. CFBP 6927 TaxID=1183428 RepID=A0ABM9VFU6_9HYPH|nr:conserved hypothetical protein [Agrobacterium genomosp. 13 str. CFBP 6927]
MILPEIMEETGRVARMTVVPPNGLEHFQEKWIPVFHPEMRQNALDRRQRNMSRSFGLFCRGQA